MLENDDCDDETVAVPPSPLLHRELSGINFADVDSVHVLTG